MSKTKHPSNRYERMRIKEIKDETRKGRTGGLRHKAQEAVVAEELDHELEVFRKQIRSQERTAD